MSRSYQRRNRRERSLAVSPRQRGQAAWAARMAAAVSLRPSAGTEPMRAPLAGSKTRIRRPSSLSTHWPFT